MRELEDINCVLENKFSIPALASCGAVLDLEGSCYCGEDDIALKLYWD